MLADICGRNVPRLCAHWIFILLAGEANFLNFYTVFISFKVLLYPKNLKMA